MRYLFLLVGILVALLSGLGAFAQDWPQWRGPNRDGKVAGFIAPKAWPGALTKQWSVPVGAGDATPALVGDKLYVFALQNGEEVTLCLNAKDGTEVWRDKNPVPAMTGPAAGQHAGPRSSPAVANGKVVTLGATGILSCLDAATGKLLWRKDEYPGAYPRFYTSASPLIADGMAVAQLGNTATGALIAYDLTTGVQKWKWDAEGATYASPNLLTVGGVKQLVALTEKRVVGIGLADGKLLWEIPFIAQGMSYNAATPIVDGDTVIYSGSGRGTKAVQIAKQGDAFAAKELWSNPDVGVQFSTPVLKDGLLFGLTDKGFLFCLDAKTGKIDWTDATRRGRGFAAILDVGAAVLALPDSGTLLVIKPDAAAYAELASLKVADKATYAFPVVAGKRLFVKDLDTLTLWTIE